jgi:hypothetical protein
MPLETIWTSPKEDVLIVTGIIATNKYLMPLVLKALQEAMKEEQQAAALV